MGMPSKADAAFGVFKKLANSARHTLQAASMRFVQAE
jgi:hypothetical protein